MEIKDNVCIVTGGAGLLGSMFSEALLEAKGIVVLLDINIKALKEKVSGLDDKYPGRCFGLTTDITDEGSLTNACKTILNRYGRIDVLVNNAASNPTVKKGKSSNFTRFESFKLSQWEKDLSVGLSGAFLCSKTFGSEMAKKKKGVIINISSDLGIVAPDQRIYRMNGLDDDRQPVKPVSYSVIKHGIIGLTKYLATYWADKGIRVNALSPGGVYTNQPEEFVKKMSSLIPMNRMADINDYKAAIVFLASNASMYMTGQNLVIDGGRSIW